MAMDSQVQKYNMPIKKFPLMSNLESKNILRIKSYLYTHAVGWKLKLPPKNLAMCIKKFLSLFVP